MHSEVFGNVVDSTTKTPRRQIKKRFNANQVFPGVFVARSFWIIKNAQNQLPEFKIRFPTNCEATVQAVNEVAGGQGFRRLE